MPDLAEILRGDRRLVMGVVNVTPDSFSDGGRWLDPDAAVAHGLSLVADGADLLDVGGESTRPGAEPVDAGEEIRRVVPVIARLAAESGVPVSIDTTKALVASTAIAAGAAVVNDVSAARFDPEILSVAAEAGAGFVAMHMRGEPRTMQDNPRYDDVVAEVGDFLAERADAAAAAGVRPDRVVVDPGIGFGKTLDHNLALLAGLADVARRAGAPLLVGASRKSFLATVLGGDVPPEARDDATLATTVWCFDRGVAIIRVHEARRARAAADLAAALERAA